MMIEKIRKSARVFFALWPEDKERAALAEWQATLHELCGGRVLRSGTLHMTLVFLGDVALHRMEELQLAAREIDGEAFKLSFDAARYWRHNRIVFAAPAFMPPQLVQLVRGLEQSLAMHRFEFDKRPYKPHVTLLRNARWSGAPLPEMNSVVWQANDFALVQSAPDEGASYRVLARFSLRLQ